MAMDYFLELEGDSPDWESCIQALTAVGVFALTRKDNVFKHANLTKSGMYCWSTTIEEGDTPVIHANGNHGCSFGSRYSIIFRLSPSEMDSCIEELFCFCEKLAALSTMGFVLSYQLDEVVATRDARGLLWTWDEPR